MNNSVINREQVFVIADALIAEGVTPTPGKIKARLGADCSYSVVSNYLVEWQKDPHRITISHLPAPPESVSQGMSQVWTQAWLLNQQQISKERQEFEVALGNIDSEKHEMLNEIIHLERTFQDQTAKEKAYEQYRNTAEAQITELDNKLNDFELEKQNWNREKNRLQAKSEELNTELECERNIVEKNNVARRDIQNKIQVLNGEKVTLNEQIAEYEYQISVLTTVQDSQERKTQLLSEKLAEHLEIQRNNTEVADLNESLSELNEQLVQKNLLLKTKDKELCEKVSQLETLQFNVAQEKIAQEEIELSNVELQEKLQNNSLEYREYLQFSNGESRQFKELIEVMEADLQAYKNNQNQFEEKLRVQFQAQEEMHEQALNSERASSAQAREVLSDENTALKAQLNTLTTNAASDADNNEVINTSTQEIEEIQTENANLIETNETLSKRVDQLAAENIELKNQHENLESKSERYKEAYEKAAAQRKEAMALMSELKSNYTKLKASSEKEKEKSEYTQQRIHDLEIRMASFRAQNNISKQTTEVLSEVDSKILGVESIKKEGSQTSVIPVLSEIEKIPALAVDESLIENELSSTLLAQSNSDVNSKFDLPHEEKQDS